ncbi:MAG: response regulator [Desulfobacteraceae bacterium]|nr:response regulator [Desulfobacteraceae bacterium]
MEQTSHKSPMTFRIVATLVVTIITMAAIVGIAIRLNRQVSKEMLTRYQQEQFVSISHQSQRLGDTLKNITNDLIMLSTHKELIEYHEKEARQLLSDFYQKHRFVIVAGYRMDKNGILKYVEGGDKKGEGVDISEQAHVKTLFKTNKTVLSGSFKAVEGYYAVAIHVPVFKEGRLDGSIATLVKWDAFKAWFEKARVSKSSFTILLDADHKIISHPKTEYIGQTLEESPAITLNNKPIDLQFLYNGNTETLSGPFFNEKKYVVASHPFIFEEVAYSLVSCAPYKDILGPMIKLSGLTFMLVGFSLLVIIIGLACLFYLFYQDKLNWLAFQKKVHAQTLERKLAEHSLNETQNTFLTVLDSIPATIYSADMETYEILFVNKYMKDSFKIDQDYSGKKCFEVFRGENQPCRHCTNSKLLDANGEPKGVYIWERENPITKKWYNNYDKAIKWVDGRIVRIQIATDITYMKEYEVQRCKMEEKLQQAKKMEAIGTLAGGVAHDLNNVLSGIVTYPELLLMTLPSDSSLVQPLEAIQSSGQKAAEIVNDLLTLARRGVSTSEIVNLNTIILEYTNSPEYNKLISYHPEISMEMHIEENLANIKGSSIHLQKTIMNLISNAVEAHLSSGKVTIKTRNETVNTPLKGYKTVNKGAYAVLEISDRGTGIAPEDLNQIFEPFYTKKVMGRSGTGLGMAVVWGAVQDHKGYISIDSQEGIGTKFSVYFPATDQAIKKEGHVIVAETYKGDGEAILVVDDIPEQRQIASTILGKLNYLVTTAKSGEEAVRYFKNETFDLLVLDMIMAPGMDGFETYKKILEDHPHQKALLASGYSETDRVKAAQRLGAGSYVKKPYSIEDLGLAVKTELQRDMQKN